MSKIERRGRNVTQPVKTPHDDKPISKPQNGRTVTPPPRQPPKPTRTTGNKH